ncbi:site-specific integrase [Variovorax robiniae]|uniref:Site-specific integrase n=1 Tax=Variovorax robiniae TaxID=1836199 RepID=A0ABU8X942_9BURK
MSGLATVSALSKLTPGERVSLGRSLYCKRNLDESFSFILRKKVDGAAKDVKVAREDTITKAAISAAFAAAEVARKTTAPATPTTGTLTASSTMNQVWDDWLASIDQGGKWSTRNRKSNVDRVNAHLSTWPMWRRPLASVTVADLYAQLLPVRKDTPAQCRKLIGLLNGIFIHHSDHIGASPMPTVVKKLANSSKAAPTKHHHAIMDLDRLREVVKKIRNLTGEASVRNAAFLQCLTAQRTGEVIQAQWSQFDLDAGTWTIPRAAMKISDDPRRGDHVLNLSTQCVQWLKDLPREGEFLFPGRMQADTITSEAVSKALRITLGLHNEHVPHGWRSSLSTLARRAVDKDGRPLFNGDWVESLLDHLSGNAVEDAYNRGAHAAGAGQVLQWWSNELLGAK